MSHHWGYVAVLSSAFIFGIGTTINKMLLESASPLLIASVTYLAGGFLLAGSSLLPAKSVSLLKLPTREKTGFVGRDLVLVLMVILFGAVLAPTAYLTGLNNTSAVSAALLGNAETLFTIGIAFIFLGERGRLKDYVAMVLLVIGAVVLTTNLNLYQFTSTGSLFGNLLVLASCLFWGIDNNVSRLLTVKRSLLQVGSLKGILGGGLLLVVTIFLGLQVVASPVSILYIVIVGIFTVGLSLLLFLFSLQEIGAMRTGVMFSTASLFGAVSAFLILREPISVVQALAGLVMLFAIYVLSIPAKKQADA
ncbi:DMT family transporter [Candidatus Bathyarchaeota archaeon]|nr:DMT family transporter [Candidatus Bathyarchaeota archaeon]